jgi:hypothetical protein
VLLTLIAASACLSAAASAPDVTATPAVAGADTRRLEFEVFLGDRAIGWQRFTLRREGDATRVETRARFAVRLLGLTAFEYDHRNVELWRGGCLQAIDSHTNSNGREHRVAGRAAQDGFVLEVRDGERRLADCVGSFAYWDRSRLLGRTRLLNSQTGDYPEVTITPLGEDRITLGARQVEVTRYALRGVDLDITLAYELGSDEWVALETRLRGDRLLRYRRSDVAAPTNEEGI